MIKNHDGTYSADLVTSAVFAVTDPKLITVDFDAINKQTQEHRATWAKLNPPVPVPIRAEYNKLRQRLYDLQQQAKGAETNLENRAGTVANLEQRINNTLKEKKAAIAEGALGQERACEHRIQLLEIELKDAKQLHAEAKHWNAQATRGLKSF